MVSVDVKHHVYLLFGVTVAGLPDSAHGPTYGSMIQPVSTDTDSGDCDDPVALCAAGREPSVQAASGSVSGGTGFESFELSFRVALLP